MSEPELDDVVPVRHGWVTAVESQLTSNGNLLGDVLKRLDALDGGKQPSVGIHLHLTPYEASNLWSLLATIVGPDSPDSPLRSLNTGDWAGTIRWMLEEAFGDQECPNPNASPEQNVARVVPTPSRMGMTGEAGS